MSRFNNLPEWLFIDAVRYCLGRRSYQVAVTTEWLRANWKHLPREARDIIMQDVERAFDRDDQIRSDVKCSSTYYPLGEDIDRAAWESVRALWSQPE